MDIKKLNEILKNHQKWLRNEEGGIKANLSSADLSGAELRCAKLSGADLSGANLSSADLSGADLSSADLSGADLSSAELRCADLSGAELRCANLSGAYLSGAYLRCAKLSGADLSCAELSCAYLSYADLSGADLDFSCLPLWCGSLTAHFDDRQLKQIAYHLVKAGLNSKNASKKTKKELSKLIDFANGFHRVNECGKIEKEKGNEKI